MKRLNKIIFIAGPTSSGKTEVAVLLAQKIKGEIISCDSMQAYQEIRIVNNKPSSKILKKVPHHLIGIVSIEKEFDVAAYNKKALAAIRSIQKKKKIPVIVGGSGLYMGILLDGIFEEGPKNIKIRRELESLAMKEGKEVLFQKLLDCDPQAAARIHPNDLKRMIRALEVYLTNQKPLSDLQRNRQGLWGSYDIKMFCLDRDREKLYERINKKVDQMFKEGLVEEIRSLMNKAWSQTAQRIIGFREVREYLNGEYDLERAKYLVKLHTRHYAKRQLTWFRKEKRLQWITVHVHESPKHIAESIWKTISETNKK